MSKNLQGSQAPDCNPEQEPASPRKGRNLQGKRRDVANPYAIYKHSGWEWRVLKHYQAPKGEATNPNARVLCQVTSPYVPQGEMGDVYCYEIPGYNRQQSMSSEERSQPPPERTFARPQANGEADSQRFAPERMQTIAPSFNTMVDWMSMGYAEATDGCRVEPDGTCPHGCKSWLLVKGLI